MTGHARSDARMVVAGQLLPPLPVARDNQTWLGWWGIGRGLADHCGLDTLSITAGRPLPLFVVVSIRLG